MHLRKDARIFIDGTILYESSTQFKNLFLFLEALCQEINLQMEAPTFEVMIELLQIWIMIDLFQRSLEIQTLCKRSR
ncbi:hypothetical protein D3C76_1776820 [compost metagenome]